MSLLIDAKIEPISYQQITDLSTPKALSVPSRANYALIQAYNGPVRWLDTGSVPTDSFGMRLSSGRDMWYTGDLGKLLFIDEVGGAELNITYYKNQ